MVLSPRALALLPRHCLQISLRLHRLPFLLGPCNCNITCHIACCAITCDVVISPARARVRMASDAVVRRFGRKQCHGSRASMEIEPSMERDRRPLAAAYLCCTFSKRPMAFVCETQPGEDGALLVSCADWRGVWPREEPAGGSALPRGSSPFSFRRRIG